MRRHRGAQHLHEHRARRLKPGMAGEPGHYRVGEPHKLLRVGRVLQAEQQRRQPVPPLQIARVERALFDQMIAERGLPPHRRRLALGCAK
jgi:hypothetical protein